MDIKKNCLYCQKEFHTDSYTVKVGGGRFCSRRCASRYGYEHGNRKFLYYARLALTNRPKVNKICVICGRKYETKYYNSTHQKYCSKECMYRAQAQQIPNKEEIIKLYKEGHSINRLWREFHLRELGVEYLLLDYGVPVRSAREQRKLMMRMGTGRWRQKSMKPCKICGRPFYSRLNKCYCSVACKYKDEETIAKMRDNTLKQIEEGRLYRSNTNIEMIVENFLVQNKIQFKHQYKLGYWCFDFFIPNNKLIEVDGDYWHANPLFFSELNHTQLKNVKNDKRKTEYARSRGYILTRFWENDIVNSFENVKKQILEVANNGK